jgi:site-specific DNA-methyltransferase (adenine-specific)
MRNATKSFPESMPAIWRAAPRRWGHRWHSMCSYMAMFPPSMPHVFIRWLTNPGDVVYDPFCGRGTTVLEACVLGRIGLGSDANPLAWILTSAKANPPTMQALTDRIAQLRSINGRLDTLDEPRVIRHIFHRDVLEQLLWLRSHLDCQSKVDRFLLATLLGVLHANANSDGTPRGLTIAMPNTFSMAPRYVLRYKARHHLLAPRKNVVDFLETRLRHLGSSPSGLRHGAAWQQDITVPSRYPRNQRPARLIFSSPPYLSVMKYGKLNWLRLWLLGHESSSVDADLFSSGSLDSYLQFMKQAIGHCSEVTADDGFICFVIGDVRRNEHDLNLAAAVADSCINGTGLRIAALMDDKVPVRHKVSRIWKDRRGYATETDRILVLAGPKARRLPHAPRIEWSAVQ